MYLDTHEKLKRLFTKGIKPIMVQFVGDPDVDSVGPVPEFFLCTLKMPTSIKPSIDELPDYHVAEKLQAINECTDEGKLHEKVANFQERFSMGFNKPTDSMEDKEKLCESITYHNCISVCIEKKAYPRTVRYYLDKANFP